MDMYLGLIGLAIIAWPAFKLFQKREKAIVARLKKEGNWDYENDAEISY